VAVVSPAVPSRNLDDPLLGAGDSAEIDMIPGRLNKVPVSWFLKYTHRIEVPQRVAFRTIGCADPADTGLIVTWNDVTGPHTAFNNDGVGQGRCSYIDTGFHPRPIAFTLYVFSMIRGTSRATLQVSLDREPWKTLATDDFGGTVVRVGALQAGDYVEVRTPSDGHGNDGTRMLLFQVPTEQSGIVNTAAIFNEEQNSGDQDPHVDVDVTWPSTHNGVLLGKDTRSSSSLDGIETHVDLIRGPLEVTAPDPAFGCNGSACKVLLPPGRYFASLFANTAHPVGSVTRGAEHWADDLGTDGEGDCPHRARGQGNDRAFTAVLRRDGIEVKRRLVPRGLLGTDPALGWNQIVFEVDADGAGSYSLHAEDRAPDVSFFGHWRYIRNPDVNEMKVATWNFGYWVFEHDTSVRIAILQNAVDLLGTRGDIDPSARTVIERGNQAPWQWDADVIAFQEFYGTTLPHVRDRLVDRSPFDWSYVNANTEIGSWPGGDNVYYGPVFVNELVRPANGIRYGNLQLNDGVSKGRCSSRLDGGDYDYACPLGVVIQVFYESQNLAVPARLRARRSLGRNGGTDRPVAFFNWHLFHYPEKFDQRATNVENLIKSIKYLMARPADGSYAPGACAFNKECVNHPLHYANRVLIMGDSNMKNHQCGEFAWTLRRLREEFGYAIDASAAVVDPMNRTYDMHWSGAPLTDPRMSLWGTCQETDGPWSKLVNADGTHTGCPFRFQHRLNWNEAGDVSTVDVSNQPWYSLWPVDFSSWAVDFSTDSWYPWWATTTQDPDNTNKGGGRFDMVFLVGRGWAYDDPVLTYRVMPHREEPAPTNGMLGGGVELGFNVDTCEGPVADGNANYAPNVSVNGCGTGEGAPAIRSDHIPTGARLRIWGR
jgi:hypothetical protein